MTYTETTRNDYDTATGGNKKDTLTERDIDKRGLI